MVRIKVRSVSFTRSYAYDVHIPEPITFAREIRYAANRLRIEVSHAFVKCFMSLYCFVAIMCDRVYTQVIDRKTKYTVGFVGFSSKGLFLLDQVCCSLRHSIHKTLSVALRHKREHTRVDDPQSRDTIYL